MIKTLQFERTPYFQSNNLRKYLQAIYILSKDYMYAEHSRNKNVRVKFVLFSGFIIFFSYSLQIVFSNFHLYIYRDMTVYFFVRICLPQLNQALLLFITKKIGPYL